MRNGPCSEIYGGDDGIRTPDQRAPQTTRASGGLIPLIARAECTCQIRSRLPALAAPFTTWGSSHSPAPPTGRRFESEQGTSNFGGDDRIRTGDLRNASAALSQLSYVPNTVCFPYYSRLSDAMVHTELRICALRIGTLRSPECRSESLPSGRCVSLHSATATYQDSRPTRGSVSTSGWRFWSVTLARSCFRITFFLRFGTATIVP